MNLTDEIAQREIERVRGYALAHRLSLDQVKEIASGVRAEVSNNPCYVMTLPRGLVVVYSVEEHPSGWYNHMLVSENGTSPAAPLATAIAIHVARPNGPERLEKGESCTYIQPDGMGINVLIPFIESKVTTLSA